MKFGKKFLEKIKNFIFPSPSESKIDFPYIRRYFLSRNQPIPTRPGFVPGSREPEVESRASESPDPQLQGSGGFDGWSEPASRLADSFESAAEIEQTKFLAEVSFLI